MSEFAGLRAFTVLISLSTIQLSCLESAQLVMTPDADHQALTEAQLEAIDTLSQEQDGRLAPDVVCAQCHPRQAEEYARSTMRYGFFSPSFNALEQSLNQLSDGKFTHQGQEEGFCSNCHAPKAISEGLIVSTERMSRTALTPKQAREGAIGCDLCHSQSTKRDPAAGLIAEGARDKLTVNQDLAPNAFHGYQQDNGSIKLSTSEFCAPCHDVRPQGVDVITKDAHLRSEDLFSEWRRSPWAQPDHPLNPLRGQRGITGIHDNEEMIARGEQVICQDCHMSLYPWRGFKEEVSYDESFLGVDPMTLTRKAHKLYPVGRSASRGQLRIDDESEEQLPLRRTSTHYFTGVSQALTPFRSSDIFDLSILNVGAEQFSVSDEWADERLITSSEWRESWREWRADERGLDRYGAPLATAERRVALLKSALSLDLNEIPSEATVGQTLRLDAWLENVGAGHNVPAGFSQERELWVSVVLSDQGRVCTADIDCADLLEAPLFLDPPNRSCVVNHRLGQLDQALPTEGSWELAARRERSAVCGSDQRCVIYRSGYLIDTDGDGRLNDEDLRHRLVDRDIDRFDERCVLPGPDRDSRLRGVERGLVHFTNSLQRIEQDDRGEAVEHPNLIALAPSAPPYDPYAIATSAVLDQDPRERRSLYPTQLARYEQARYRPALPGELGVSRRGLGLNAPTHLRANRAFNGQALAPFAPRLARYDVLIPEGAEGPLKVELKVRFRFFSPRTLFTLVARHPEALREEMIDEGLEIVDMASGEKVIELLR